MATADAEARDEKGLTAGFSDDEITDIFREAETWVRMVANDDVSLVCRTLFSLARNFGGESLNDLKQKNPWLAAFEPGPNPEWKEATTAYIDNGPTSLDTLTLFTNMKRSENLLGTFCRSEEYDFARHLLAICDELENNKGCYEVSPTLDERIAYETEEFFSRNPSQDTAKGVKRNRVKALFRNLSLAEESVRFFGNFSLEEGE